MQDCKVSILGTEYSVLFREESEKPKLKNCDGYIDTSIKEIVICIFEPDDMSIADLESFRKKVLRHEIIHGFLYESGLWEQSGNADPWACSETITDWIALQFSKMHKAFIEVGAL